MPFFSFRERHRSGRMPRTGGSPENQHDGAHHQPKKYVVLLLSFWRCVVSTSCRVMLGWLIWFLCVSLFLCVTLFFHLGNRIGEEGTRALADALETNTTVHSINFDGMFCCCHFGFALFRLHVMWSLVDLVLPSCVFLSSLYFV